MWGFDANNIWAVGANGVVRQWNGSTWVTRDTGTLFHTGLFGNADDNVYISSYPSIPGTGNRIYHWNGTTLSQQGVSSPNDEATRRLWMLADPVAATGLTLDNPSYEIIGREDGAAEDWDNANDPGSELIVAHDGSIVPFETYESGWGLGNQLFLEEFGDADLERLNWNGTTGQEEKYDYSWKLPNIDGTMFLSTTTGFTVGDIVRDKTTGAIGVVKRIDSGTQITLTFVNLVEAGAGLFAPTTASILAVLNYGSMDLDTGDGVDRQIGGTLSGLPVHEGTLVVKYVVGGEIKQLTDDGAGNLVGDLDPLGANSITYATGVVNALLLTAPDDGSVITATWEYGAVYATAITIPFGIFQESPFASSSILEFDSSSLQRAIFSGDDNEDYEDGWKLPQVTGIPAGTPPPYNESSVTDLASAVVIAAIFDTTPPETVEDYEEEWRNNENSVVAYTEKPQTPYPPVDTSELLAVNFSTAVGSYDTEDYGDNNIWNLAVQGL
jgi:hypothetical protein